METKIDFKGNNVVLTRSETVKANIKSKVQLHILKKFISKGHADDTRSYLESFHVRRSGNIGSEVRSYRKNMQDLSKNKLEMKKPGSVLARFNEQFDCTRSKTPLNNSFGEWIGVELECFIPRASLSCDDLDSGGGYEDEDGNWIEPDDDDSNSTSECFDTIRKIFIEKRIKNVSAKRDSSIECDDSNEEFAVEFAVLFKRDDTSNLKKLCDLLKEWGAKVNKSTGMHVHLDCRDLIEAVSCDVNTRGLNARGKRIGNTLQVLSQMVPASRRSNHYCKLEVGKLNGGRYFAVNMSSFNKFKTIEVRLHSGTIDFDKVINWVELLYTISRERGLSRNAVSNYSELSERLSGASTTLMSYVKARIEKFSPSVAVALDGLARELGVYRSDVVVADGSSEAAA